MDDDTNTIGRFLEDTLGLLALIGAVYVLWVFAAALTA